MLVVNVVRFCVADIVVGYAVVGFGVGVLGLFFCGFEFSFFQGMLVLFLFHDLFHIVTISICMIFFWVYQLLYCFVF